MNRRKKSGFLTFCFSLIPGAGEMYLGFMKMGVSLMGLFFAVIVVGGFLNVASVMLIDVIVWFYSFFHVNHLVTLPDDEFYMVEDDYFFHIDALIRNRDLLLTKYRKLTSYCLIFLGAAVVWQNAINFFHRFLGRYLAIPEPFRDMLFWFTQRAPQMVVAVGIILLGIWLIQEKKSSLFLTTVKRNRQASN